MTALKGTLLSVFLILLAAGCGNSNRSSNGTTTPIAPTGTTGTNGGGGSTTSPTPFVFVGTPEGNLVELKVDSATGAAVNSNSSGAPASTSVQAPVHSVGTTFSGNFVYVGTDSGIAAFRLDSAGTLTPVSGSPFALAGSNAAAMTVDRSGNALYVVFSGSNLVASYTIDATTGALSQPTTATTGDTPVSLTTEPSGKFLYVSNQNSHDISAFLVSNGALSAVSESPFNDAPEASPISGSGAIVAADSFVYVLSDRWILGYSVDAATGKLNPLPASAGQNPGVLLPLNTAMTMVADPNGAFS